MTLRDKVTAEICKIHPIPQDKQNSEYSFYYTDYNDNLFCNLGPAALAAYEKGSGGETKETYNKRYNKHLPPKIASIASSSAMTFNLLGNDPIVIPSDYMINYSADTKPAILPAGTYCVNYEQQMYTLQRGSNPANLDAYLYDEKNETAIFCEMKTLEWLSSPGTLKDIYRDKAYFFEPKHNAVGYEIDAFEVFNNLIGLLMDGSKRDTKKKGHELIISKYDAYDAWQMLKHTLAIYNYTSQVTGSPVDSLKNLAGKFKRIILLNVINELPKEWINDKKVRDNYVKRLNQEKEQSQDFIDIMMSPDNNLRRLFRNNCNAEFNIAYMSAKEFASLIDMSGDRRNYLKRYFE